MSDVITTITYFAILLGLGVLIANVFKKRNFPDTVFLILLGLILGPTVLGNPAIAQYVKIEPINIGEMGNVPDFLRTLALVLIVFTGMFNVGFRVFKKSSGVAIKLAFVTAVVNTILIGAAAHFIFGLEWVFAFLLGGILSGTADAIIFTFDAVLKDYKRPLTILKSEAIFNSPICILIPLILLDFLALQPGAQIQPMLYFSKFVEMIIAGVGAGIVLGIGFAKLVRRMVEEYTVLLLLSISLLTFAAAEYVGGSGILAVAVCGLIVGDMAFPEKEEVKRFEDHFSEMLRIAVFTFLGAQVTLFLGINEIILSLLFFIAIVMIRPITLVPLLGSERKSYTRQELFVMSFVAPRGIDAAAMAPIVAGALVAANYGAEAEKILNSVVFTIILTVIFSTVVAKFAASKRFRGAQTSVKIYAKEDDKEEIEDELEEEIESQEVKPQQTAEKKAKPEKKK
ncbi:MAG: cation:proton antiporter [Candidatus Aenigmatarchaeota archaeon]